MKLALIALVGTAGVLAAAAAQPEAPTAPAAPTASVPAGPRGSGCFFTRDIVAHRIGDGRTLFIRTRANNVFRLDMSGACLAGRSNDDPLIIRSSPGTQQVCRAADMDISIGNAGMPPSVGAGAFRTPCIVRTLTQLTPAQAAALPPRSRP